MAGVEFREVLVDRLDHALDAVDQQRAVALLEVGSAEPAVREDQVAGEQDLRLGGVETQVVVLVPRRVHGEVVVVTEVDGVAVRDLVVHVVEPFVEAPDVDVEGVDDVRERPDVVGVGVREDDCVEVVDVLADGRDHVEVVPRVDEHGALAGHEKDVAREAGFVRGEVADHVLAVRGTVLTRVEAGLSRAVT